MANTEKQKTKADKPKVEKCNELQLVCLYGKCKTPSECEALGEICIEHADYPGQMFRDIPKW